MPDEPKKRPHAGRPKGPSQRGPYKHRPDVMHWESSYNWAPKRTGRPLRDTRKKYIDLGPGADITVEEILASFEPYREEPLFIQVFIERPDPQEPRVNVRPPDNDENFML